MIDSDWRREIRWPGQIVALRRGPERAHSSMGERGPQKQGREIPGSPGNRGGGVRIFWGGMGCMGAEDPSTVRNQSSTWVDPSGPSARSRGGLPLIPAHGMLHSVDLL